MKYLVTIAVQIEVEAEDLSAATDAGASYVSDTLSEMEEWEPQTGLPADDWQSVAFSDWFVERTEKLS